MRATRSDFTLHGIGMVANGIENTHSGHHPRFPS
jgi:hypothetical protein